MHKIIAIFLTTILFFSSYPLIFQNSITQKAYAETRVYFEDGLGNVRFVTNYTGSKVRSYDYDPFCNLRLSNGSSNTNYRFNTQQLDSESGMYCLRARYFDPAFN